MRMTFIALASFLLTTTASHAQTLYRCGSTYQDRPCEGSVAGKAVGVNIPAAAPAVKAADPLCTQQGADAINIMWMKEGGRTEAEQTADSVSKGISAEFVRYVYGKRGSATQVRAQIEADCTAAQERKAQAAKLNASASQLSAQDPPASRPSPAAANPPQAAPAPASTTKASKEDGQARSDLCKSLKDQIASTKAAQRAGGSAEVMESFGQQMRQIDNQLRSLGCS